MPCDEGNPHVFRRILPKSEGLLFQRSVYKETEKLLRLTPAKYKSEHAFLKEVDSLALANAQLNLEAAYRNFFRGKSNGFPKFKSKHKDKKSYTTNCGNVLDRDINAAINIKQEAIRLLPIG